MRATVANLSSVLTVKDDYKFIQGQSWQFCSFENIMDMCKRTINFCSLMIVMIEICILPCMNIEPLIIIKCPLLCLTECEIIYNEDKEQSLLHDQDSVGHCIPRKFNMDGIEACTGVIGR